MWLDNRNIATVFVDLNVFNECKRLLPSGIHLIKSSNSATNFTEWVIPENIHTTPTEEIGS
jgi:hypothetical protein